MGQQHENTGIIEYVVLKEEILQNDQLINQSQTFKELIYMPE